MINPQRRPLARSLSRRRVIVAGGAAAITAPLVARPAAAAAQVVGGPLVTLLSPVRVFDSREASSVLGGAKFAAGDAVAVNVGPFESGFALSVFVNVTITETEGAGFLTVWPGDASDTVDPPTTSNINWTGPGMTLANLALSQVGQENSIEVRCGGAGRTHVIVDFQGYVPFEPG
jgi:hypothetical protein